MQKFKVKQWAYFIHTHGGIKFGYEPITQVLENDKEVKYWFDNVVCHQSQVFENKEELKAELNSEVDKLGSVEPFNP